MLPLIPIALSIAPELARWLFGDSASKTAEIVSATVKNVTGAEDTDAVQAVLARDPQLATQLRLQLAQVAAQSEQASRQADLDLLTAQVRDVADARAQTIALVGQHSLVSWGAPVVSMVVLASFGVVMSLALTRSIPAGSETILNMLLGTLAAMATSVVSYWVGSSAGSARKDDRLARQGRG